MAAKDQRRFSWKEKSFILDLNAKNMHLATHETLIRNVPMCRDTPPVVEKHWFRLYLNSMVLSLLVEIFFAFKLK